MLNNFIYAKTKALFEEQLDAGNVLDEAIVFIEDTKEIWNHGTYFGGDSVEVLVGNDAISSEEGFLFIDEDEDALTNVYNKTETDTAIQTAIATIDTKMPITVIDSSTTACSLAIGNWYIHSPGSSAVTYTLPAGGYTGSSTSRKVEEIWLEFTKSSGSVTFTGSGGIEWPGDTTPTFTSGITYQISFTAKYTSTDSTVKWLAAVSQEYTL